MRVFISGICGFVGSSLALALCDHGRRTSTEVRVCGIDNFSRSGSKLNLPRLQHAGVEVKCGDVRNPDDISQFDACDWMIDAAANASVVAGTSTTSPARELVDVNLIGTINQLEYCRQYRCGLVLLSTSRVYSIVELRRVPLADDGEAFKLDDQQAQQPLPSGISMHGIAEQFSTAAPISLYGSTKLAAETLALEYMHAFGFPVWINRCGVMSGAGQFGKQDQGIFAFWLHSWRESKPLRYVGFGGSGQQVRDILHPNDLASLVWQQLQNRQINGQLPRVLNVGGGMASARSLKQLSKWCADRWGLQEVDQECTERVYDLPWIVLDHSLATTVWGWRPTITADAILQEIAEHADMNPDWLSQVL